MSASLRVVRAFSRGWTRLYTARMPAQLRIARRMEIDADLWEHEDDGRRSGVPPAITAAEMLLRTCLGALDDVLWRVEVVRAFSRNPIRRRIPMVQLSTKQMRWMGLCGVAGGLYWITSMLVLFPRRGAVPRTEREFIGAGVFSLLLILGLLGFLAQQREHIGRKGAIGVYLLIAALASFFLLNMLATLPAFADGSIVLAILGVAFMFLPIVGFITLGLAMRGAQRVASFAVAILGPLGTIMPFILAKFIPVAPQWKGEDVPGHLPFGVTYFLLMALWLTVMGYFTYKKTLKGPPSTHAHP